MRGLPNGILVEFFSAVDAVGCAVEIQKGMAERNACLAPAGGMMVSRTVHDQVRDKLTLDATEPLQHGILADVRARGSLIVVLAFIADLGMPGPTASFT